MGGIELLSLFTNHGSLKCALLLSSSSPPPSAFLGPGGFYTGGIGTCLYQGTFGLSFKTVAVGVIVSWYFLAYRVSVSPIE
jgi:hypothetical protein